MMVRVVLCSAVKSEKIALGAGGRPNYNKSYVHYTYIKLMFS